MLSFAVISALESEISRIYAQVETDLVARIASELSKGTGASISPVSWRVEKLRQMGKVQGQLADLLRRESRNISPDIEDAIVKAMLGAGAADDEILKQVAVVKEQIAAGTWVPAKESTVYQSLAEAAIRNARTALNLTNTSALQAGTQAFQSSVNGAYLRTLTGSTSLDQAVKRAVRELGGSGVRLTYSSNSGRVTAYSLDAAVRRDVVTSVNQASAEMTVGRMDEYGLDLVEVTAHAGSRPEHAVWQGKVYSLHGKTPGYQLLSVATGYGQADGLAGCNCRHTFYPYYPGLSKQTDTSSLPGKRENDELYKQTQQQRYLERQIRTYKRQAAACEAAGDTQGATDASSKVKQYQSRMRALVNDTGLTRQYQREQV